MKILRVCMMLLMLFLLSSCKDHDTVIDELIDVTVKQDLGAGGSFSAVNLTTNDKVEMSGLISVTTELEVLSAHNGDKIKLSFIKNAKYDKYTFKTAFTLHDGTKVEKEGVYEYEYSLTDVAAGEYRISLSASSTKQQIMAVGSFMLKVEE